MNIKIEKSLDHYRADCLDLAGTSPVGLGESPEMAVACLFYRMQFESTKIGNWMDFLEKGEPIQVNGKIWDWPESYRK